MSEELSPLCYALQAVIERNREEAREEAEKNRPALPRIAFYYVVCETLDGISTEPQPWGPEPPGYEIVRPIPSPVRAAFAQPPEPGTFAVRRYGYIRLQRRSDGYSADVIYREKRNDE